MDQQRDICLFLTRSKNLKKILLNPKNSRCHAEKIRARKTRFAIFLKNLFRSTEFVEKNTLLF